MLSPVNLTKYSVAAVTHANTYDKDGRPLEHGTGGTPGGTSKGYLGLLVCTVSDG